MSVYFGFPKAIFYHAYSIWLFLFSDLKTIVIPMTVFGIVNALSTIAYQIDQTDVASTFHILARIPHTVLWVVSNLLPFLIDNQRHPKCIVEDSMNKPWRPLPSKRLHPNLARTWMLVLYPIAVALSSGLGGFWQSVILLCLGVWYNDLGGADVHYAIRNLINAGGFISYASGAMEVALKKPLQPNKIMLSWFGLIILVVFSSVHSQDLPDQVGDRLCGRNSVPLALGDSFARWSIVASVSAFSVLCPLFWDSALWVTSVVMFLGAVVCARTTLKRTTWADKKTFRFWNLWMAIIYSLPFVKSLQIA